MGTIEDAIEIATAQADAFTAVGDSLMRQGEAVSARVMWNKATTIRELTGLLYAKVNRDQDVQWHQLLERIQNEPADDVHPLTYRNVDGMVN